MRSFLIAALVTLLASPALTAPRSGSGKDELKRYCSGDAATFCGGVDPGREMNACFRTHMRELSEGCRRAITDYKKGRG